MTMTTSDHDNLTCALFFVKKAAGYVSRVDQDDPQVYRAGVYLEDIRKLLEILRERY